jgi:hypothetical protein
MASGSGRKEGGERAARHAWDSVEDGADEVGPLVSGIGTRARMCDRVANSR